MTVPSPPQSLTATSVTVSWDQPPFSFTPVDYIVTVERVTGSGLCPDMEDTKAPMQFTTAMPLTFSQLQEFSTYWVEVAARFNEFGSSPIVRPTETFMTPSAGTQC